MRIQPMILLLLVLGLSAAALSEVLPYPWMSPEPELRFQVKDGQQRAYLALTLNNSPAIIQTNYSVDEEKKVVTLVFAAIQNPDLFRKSVRLYAPEWNLKKIRREDYTFVVTGSLITLTTGELQDLSPDHEKRAAAESIR